MNSEDPKYYLKYKSWWDYIDDIKRRPEMWIGNRSIIGLNHFFDGMRDAEKFYVARGQKPLFESFWDEFEDWFHVTHNKRKLTLRSFDVARNLAKEKFPNYSPVKLDSEASKIWFDFYDEFKQL